MYDLKCIQNLSNWGNSEHAHTHTHTHTHTQLHNQIHIQTNHGFD